MQANWPEIEAKHGFKGAESFAKSMIMPKLQRLPLDITDKKGVPPELTAPFTLSFILFLLCIFGVHFLIPDNFIGGVVRFFLFPFLFLGSIALTLFVFRNRFLAFLMRGQERFVARAEILSAIAAQAGLSYIPVPGGAPTALNKLAKWRFLPTQLRESIELVEDHGGMELPLKTAIESGIMANNAVVIGSKKQKDQYQEQLMSMRQLEDGFHGERNGIEFDAFEWKESVQDQAPIDHLVLVFTAPTKLTGTTQLSSKGAGWPLSKSDVQLKPVSLGVKDFDTRFRLRATDQVEARVVFNPAVIERVIELAHGEKIRAVAFDTHLVFDIAGTARFDILNLATGAWSEQTVKQTYADISELLDLVDAVAHTFMVEARSSKR